LLVLLQHKGSFSSENGPFAVSTGTIVPKNVKVLWFFNNVTIMPRKNSIVDEWTDNQQKFFYWYVNPNKGLNGIPRLQKDWAAENGVHPNSCTNWVKDPVFQEQAVAFRRQILLQDLPEIYKALSKKAKAGSFQHIKLALELAGEYSEEKTLNINDKRNEIVDMIDNTLEDRINKLKEKAGIN